MRIYKTECYAEFEWMVGDIPVGDNNGREIVTRFDTNIESDGVFYTDANGREMLRRRRDFRDTWTLSLLEKIAGNYYPVTAKIAIEDANHRMAILTDRSQGGSSLFDGSVEIMVIGVQFLAVALITHITFPVCNAPTGPSPAITRRCIWRGRSAERDRLRQGFDRTRLPLFVGRREKVHQATIDAGQRTAHPIAEALAQLVVLQQYVQAGV